MCAEKALQRDVNIWDYMKTYIFKKFCLFLTFPGVFIIILILLFLLVYISFLALLSLLKF